MIPIYIISLADHKYKRDKIISQIGDRAYEIIEAVDARKMSYEHFSDYKRFFRLSFYGKDLIGPEFGCYLSHKKVYQRIIEGKIPYALVLEDDAILEDNFFLVLENLLKKYPKFDLIRFLGKYKIDNKPRRNVLPLISGFNLVRLHGSPGGTYAYVISQAGAKKMLSRMKNIFTAIDALMGLQFLTKIDILTVYPKIATWDDSLGTTIGDLRYKKNLKGYYKITYPFTRILFKLVEETSKIFFYFKYYFKDKKSFKSPADLKLKRQD